MHAIVLCCCVMKLFLMVLVGLGMLSVLGVLVAGMIGMARSEPDPERSNRLMRWRVILQAVTIVLFLLLMAIGRS